MHLGFGEQTPYKHPARSSSKDASRCPYDHRSRDKGVGGEGWGRLGGDGEGSRDDHCTRARTITGAPMHLALECGNRVFMSYGSSATNVTHILMTRISVGGATPAGDCRDTPPGQKAGHQQGHTAAHKLGHRPGGRRDKEVGWGNTTRARRTPPTITRGTSHKRRLHGWGDPWTIRPPNLRPPAALGRRSRTYEIRSRSRPSAARDSGPRVRLRRNTSARAAGRIATTRGSEPPLGVAAASLARACTRRQDL